MTDWKTEIEERLAKSNIYKILNEKLELEGKAIKGQQIFLVFEAVDYAYQKSKLILKYMPDYTLHDGVYIAFENSPV